MKTNILTAITVLCFLNISVAQNYKFGKVSKEELLQKQHPTDPSADAAILYQRNQYRISIYSRCRMVYGYRLL